jgi:hypothetical protein
LFGGEDASGGNYRNDTWVLPLSDNPAPVTFTMFPTDTVLPGDSLRVKGIIGLPLAGPSQPFQVTTHVDRAWAGGVASTIERLSPQGADTVEATIVVPDSAAAGVVGLGVDVGWAGAPALGDHANGSLIVAASEVTTAPTSSIPGVAGDTAIVTWIVRNPTSSARDYTCFVAIGRSWPNVEQAFAMPAVGPGASDTVMIRVPVPDSAAAGSIALRLRVGRPGVAPHDSASVILVIPPTVASSPQVEAYSDGVQLTWQTTLAAGTRADVWVSRGDGPWSDVAAITVDGSGRCTYSDPAAQPGTSSRYRLTATVNGAVAASPIVSVTVPVLTPFALHGFGPNPSRGVPRVSFSLAQRGPAKLEVFDLAGRRVWSQSWEELPPGRQELSLEAANRWRPGLFIIRLTQGSKVLTSRGAVIP